MMDSISNSTTTMNAKKAIFDVNKLPARNVAITGSSSHFKVANPMTTNGHEQANPRRRASVKEMSTSKNNLYEKPNIPPPFPRRSSTTTIPIAAATTTIAKQGEKPLTSRFSGFKKVVDDNKTSEKTEKMDSIWKHPTKILHTSEKDKKKKMEEEEILDNTMSETSFSTTEFTYNDEIPDSSCHSTASAPPIAVTTSSSFLLRRSSLQDRVSMFESPVKKCPRPSFTMTTTMATTTPSRSKNVQAQESIPVDNDLMRISLKYASTNGRRQSASAVKTEASMASFTSTTSSWSQSKASKKTVSPSRSSLSSSWHATTGRTRPSTTANHHNEEASLDVSDCSFAGEDYNNDEETATTAWVGTSPIHRRYSPGMRSCRVFVPTSSSSSSWSSSSSSSLIHSPLKKAVTAGRDGAKAYHLHDDDAMPVCILSDDEDASESSVEDLKAIKYERAEEKAEQTTTRRELEEQQPRLLLSKATTSNHITMKQRSSMVTQTLALAPPTTAEASPKEAPAYAFHSPTR